MYSSCWKPSGGDDLPCHGMSNAMTRIVVRDARVVQQAAELPSIRARVCRHEKRNTSAGLLEVEPVRAIEQIEIEIAADDRFEARAHWHSRPKDGVASLAHSRPKDGVASLAYALLARRREHVLEVEQVRHERVQIALDCGEHCLARTSAKISLWPGHRDGLPEHLPFVTQRTQCEAVVRRHEWGRRDGNDAALDDFDEIALVADFR